LNINIDGVYGCARIDNFICGLCYKKIPCIITDSSHGEYNEIPICLDCVVENFKKYDELQNK
jgi:hypothetical protein